MKQLPLDYTFCSGLRCSRIDDCLRYIRRPGNEDRFADRNVSMAQFADADGVCEKFIEERSNDLPERSAP